MEMDLLKRKPVRLAFRLRDYLENLARKAPRAVSHFCLADYLKHIVQVPVLMVMMLVMISVMLSDSETSLCRFFVALRMTVIRRFFASL